MKIFRNRIYWLLLLILLLAGTLRFYQISRADVITDESLFAFRSIGYIDFFVSPYQTTPYEWFSDIPNWARISFHDAPPLVFLIQHFSFVIFGQNLFALRLPFVLAGILSVPLIYLIGKKLFAEKAGLIAALLLAVSNYHVWISRIGLQESILIFFSLLTFYLFLLALEKNKYWFFWGVSFGLALLTKYLALVLVPIFVIYLLFYQRKVFKDKNFWFGVLISILIFSPVIIYNFKLFQSQGHFDLQFSYLFGQQVSEWQFLPGKIQAGDFSFRLQNLIPAIYQGLLWPMFILSLISFIFALYYFLKQKNKSIFWLILAIFFHLLLFLVIGPAQRFVVILVPFLVLLVAWFIAQQKRLVSHLLILIIVILEIFFSFNTLLAYQPIGPLNLTYSNLNKESYNWGYNQLNNYLVQLLENKQPALTFETRYQFLEDIKNQALAKATKKNLNQAAILLIYDVNMYDLATLWLFHRRMVYQGWPIITADDYLKQGKDFWQNFGVTDFYFFKIVDQEMLRQPLADQTESAEILSEQLKDLSPEIIKRPDGREVFAVYHWQ